MFNNLMAYGIVQVISMKPYLLLVFSTAKSDS